MDKRKLNPHDIRVDVTDPEVGVVEKEIKEAYRIWVRDIMIEKGWDTNQLANAAGISRTVISLSIHKDSRDISFSAVARIALAADKPLPVIKFSSKAVERLSAGKKM